MPEETCPSCGDPLTELHRFSKEEGGEVICYGHGCYASLVWEKDDDGELVLVEWDEVEESKVADG